LCVAPLSLCASPAAALCASFSQAVFSSPLMTLHLRSLSLSSARESLVDVAALLAADADAVAWAGAACAPGGRATQRHAEASGSRKAAAP
jgi:hypothetical protein